MKTISLALISVLACIFSLIAAAQSRPAGDLIITNAKVWTVDRSNPAAQAVAVLGDRIVSVGSNSDVNNWRGPNTRVIDAEGKLMLPGFNDSHVHFVNGGLALDAVQLNDATSPEEFARRIAERAKQTPKGEWIMGGDWDETKWTPAKLPTKALIDPVTPGTPIFASRYDGHMSLANSVALRLAGITTKTPDPPGGVIVRDAQGNPTGAVKDFADGSLGSATAYFFQPFDDQPNNHGILSDEMHPVSLMHDRMMKADAAGLQLCTHAIGDQAISMILDIYSEITQAHGEADRRFRIEHAQHMAAKDFDRFAQLHVIASVQPYHAIDDGRWAEGRIGHDRASRTYAFRTFLNHGVRLALGTDWDVAPLNPMLTVYAAVTRATLDGKNPNGWFPEQKLTVPETIETYTMGSAYAEFQENEKGSITPGKLADMG